MVFHAVSPTQLLSLYLRLAQGVHGDAQGAGDRLHSAADTGSELLEASWRGPESELKMDTDIATACSRFPSNPKPKRSFFFSCPRRYWHSSKHRGTRWRRNTAKTGWGEEGKGISVKELA